MATTHRVTTVPYLQRWDSATRTLALRLLIAPTGDPLAPFVASPAGVPAFADAALAFELRVSDAPEALPERTSVVVSLPTPLRPPTAPPDARPIWAAIKAALAIPDGPAGDTFVPPVRDAVRQIRKYLPGSYREAFPFVRPRTSLAVVDDSYRCLMACPPDPEPPRPPTVIGWGQAIAFALRQPRLAEALGLIVPAEVTVPAGLLDDGGWLWVDLAAGSDLAAQAAVPGFVRGFATRVPALDPASDRSLFTPVLFPVSDTAAAAAALGNYDRVFIEAVRFDDGFSKIVHARQPISSDILDESGTGPAIARDEGVQLAWDDEDVVEGQNRSFGAPPDGEDAVIAPRGVLGYRVDVRAAGTSTWTSLSRVSAPLSLGVDLGTAIEERWTEVTPTTHSGQTWLPPWYARWRGGSLVADGEDDRRLMELPPGTAGRMTPVGADAVELRYGRRYEFRARLADTTGGGPGIAAADPTLGESPIAPLHFRRHRAPSAAIVDPVAEPADGRVATVSIRRPRLGFPEAVYAAGAPARAELLARIAANDLGDPADAIAPAIPDPDVTALAVRVLLKAPTFDPAADRNGFVEWYATTRRFPAASDGSLDLALDWIDVADIATVDLGAQLGAEGTVAGPLVVPTGRDVRLEVRALGRDDLAYFADASARRGIAGFLDLHARVAVEAAPLRALPDADACRSVFLRRDPVDPTPADAGVPAAVAPSPVLLERLAAATELRAVGTLLTAEEGVRTVFGCSGIAHHLAPDGSSLEFGDPAELAGQWISVVRLDLDRDWTWRGAGSPAAVLSRTTALVGVPGSEETREVASVELMPSISTQAARTPDRSVTRIVFVDAQTPRMRPDGLPAEIEVSYTATLRFESAPTLARTIATRLPIVTPPRQQPVVVGAGIALTPYERTADYSATSSRVRRLWIEFAEPLADPRDAYFARPVTSSPDPLLLAGSEPLADATALDRPVLDPELARVITPGQVEDLAGWATMQRMEPSPTSDRHFLLPLPPDTGPGSPELFAFFTYELRVGHDRGSASDPLWSTAQGRFGPALVLDGVQHPVPELPCSVLRTADEGIEIRAPFAAAYAGLKRALPMVPNTELWAVLYAQVMQADGATPRNIQLTTRRLELASRDSGAGGPAVEGSTRWGSTEVVAALDGLGLGSATPLSALAVELLPEPNGGFDDPLGGDLGEVRILRTSPLSKVPGGCCT